MAQQRVEVHQPPYKHKTPDKRDPRRNAVHHTHGVQTNSHRQGIIDAETERRARIEPQRVAETRQINKFFDMVGVALSTIHEESEEDSRSVVGMASRASPRAEMQVATLGGQAEGRRARRADTPTRRSLDAISGISTVADVEARDELCLSRCTVRSEDPCTADPVALPKEIDRGAGFKLAIRSVKITRKAKGAIFAAPVGVGGEENSESRVGKWLSRLHR